MLFSASIPIFVFYLIEISSAATEKGAMSYLAQISE